jgi:hypothetical protein
LGYWELGIGLAEKWSHIEKTQRLLMPSAPLFPGGCRMGWNQFLVSEKKTDRKTGWTLCLSFLQPFVIRVLP